MTVPKNKRSKFIAEIIEKNLPDGKLITQEQTDKFWKDFATKFPNKIKNKKSAVGLIRENRELNQH